MSQANIHSIKDSKITLKKSLGQNFLKDENIVKKIVATANVDETTSVIEIGPGIGALTQIMLQKNAQVVAVEIDQRLIPILEENFAGDNFDVINEDFLKIDPNVLKDMMRFKNVKVVANLPYYITSAIINKILLEMKFVDELYIMVQKEVAERITSEPNQKSYNSLSVFCQTVSDVKYEFTVKKTVFNPMPKIDSAIISFKRKDVNIDIAKLEVFVQHCFKQKRKTLVNNLAKAYQLEKQAVGDFLVSQGFLANVRSEQITVEQFHNLFLSFMDWKNNG